MINVLSAFGKFCLTAAIGAFLLMAGPVAAPGQAGAQAQSASSIVVQGNRRIEADTIRGYFQPGPNGRLDAYAIDQGQTSLFATGLFEDVDISRQGGRIVVTVVENPVINRVAFEGNSKLKDPVLANEVQSKPRGPFNRGTVQADVQRIIEIYSRTGRLDATVEPKIIPLDNGRVDLVFEITEGTKTKIARIVFVGNDAYSDGRLRDEMTTSQSNWLSWLKSSDVYDPDRLNADLELLRRFYMNKGYADFRVVSAVADLDRQRNAFFITITVEEGGQYTFGEVDIESNIVDVDPAMLRGYMRNSPGDTYNAEDVDKTVEELSVELASRGYAFARVRPRGSRDYDTRTISVIYVIEEGPRVYVERINVRGNTRTRDYVIRREFDIAEGDAYNHALINRAERRLNNLGYFKTVRISSEPGSAPDRLIVNVDVEDQATGEFSVAGGFSTAEGFIAEVGIQERNFLGRGQYLKLAGTYGERSRGVSVGFTEPYFLGRRISAGIDAFWRYADNSTTLVYEVETIGGGLRLGLPITENFRVGLNYQIYQREILLDDELTDGCRITSSTGTLPDGCTGFGYTEPYPRNLEASFALKQAEGTTITSLVGYSLVYNSLDNVNSPSSGIYANFSQDFAGVGGDVQFVRTTFDGRYYRELMSDITGIARIQAGNVFGWGDDPLRSTDHFTKGPDLVRGFATAGIGPRDIFSSREDAVGGTTYVGGSLEAQFPIFGLPKELGLRGAVFADAGTLFNYEGPYPTDFGAIDNDEFIVDDDATIRSSVGASLLWKSPLGPIRFDYAFVLSEGKYDETQAFRFSGGGRF